MAKRRTTSYSGNASDLLATVKRDKKNVGDEYLKASDFYVGPDLTNEDYYPSKNRDINVGSASSKSLGTQPIFVGYGNEAPMAVSAKRQKAFDEAAVKAKLYNIAVDEKKKDALGDLNKLKADDKEVPMQYNQDYQSEGLDIVSKYRKMAESDPAFASPTDALNDLSNINGKYGSQMQRDLVAHKVYGENLNQAIKISTDLEKNIAAGNFVPDGTREAVRRFNAGEFKGQDASKIAFDMTAMGAMKDMLPELNAFNASFDSTKDNGRQEIHKANVEPSAKGFVRAKMQGGQGMALAASLGLAPNASEDEMTKALTDQVWRKHSHQQDDQSSGSGSGDGKNARFTWEKGQQSQGGTQDKSVVSSGGAVNINVSVPGKSSPVVGDGYSFQYLPSGGETTPNKGWRFTHSIDPTTGEVTEGAGQVSGQLTRVVPALNKNTGKTEWTAEISIPAHSEKQPNPDYPDDRSEDVTVQLPDKSILIPYDENSTEIETHTRDKRGQNGFVLSQSEKDQYKKEKKSDSSVPSATKAEWIKAGWNEDQISRAVAQGKIKLQ